MGDTKKYVCRLGTMDVLGLIFVVLKLTHLIDWSWWWVTLPFWGGLALILAFYIIILVLDAIFVG